MSTSRFGYVLAALINLALAWVVNVWPGWESLHFLTPEASQVIPLITLSLLLGAALNILYIVTDPPWLKSLGSIATTAISVLVFVRLLSIFPFDFGDASLWNTITEGLLILMVVVTSLAVLVQVVQFIRLLLRGPADELSPPA